MKAKDLSDIELANKIVQLKQDSGDSEPDIDNNRSTIENEIIILEAEQFHRQMINLTVPGSDVKIM